MQRKVENLILGGGFAGFEMASRLDDSVIVAAEFNGLLNNYRVGDFTFDLGGHVYTRDDIEVEQLMRETGAKIHADRKAYYIHDKMENAIEFPVQNHADALGIELAGDGNTNPKNFAEYAASVFGKDFCERFFYPFNSRVWTTDPRKMSFDWINGRIKLPSESSERWGMNASFSYAPGPDIISTLLKRIKNVDLVKAEVLDINYAEHYVMTTAGSFKYRNLFDTTGKAFDRQIGNGSLVRNYVISIGLGFKQELPFDFHWVYGKVGADIHRITLLSRYHPSLAPSGQDSLLMEIPIGNFTELRGKIRQLVSQSLPEEQKIDVAVSLAEATGLATAKDIYSYIPYTYFAKVSRGYPIPTLGSREIVSEQKAKLIRRNAYTFGRWGSHGYFNLQHLIKDVDATMAAFRLRESKQDISPEDAPEYFGSTFYYKR